MRVDTSTEFCASSSPVAITVRGTVVRAATTISARTSFGW